jgi:plastocyanin
MPLQYGYKMKILHLSIIVIMMISLFINTGIVFGQYAEQMPSAEFSLGTDKQSYGSNDTITVFGNVDRQIAPAKDLNVEIRDLYGTIYKNDTVAIDGNGNYKYQFKILGSHVVTGTYIVRVWNLYYNLDLQNSFHFTNQHPIAAPNDLGDGNLLVMQTTGTSFTVGSYVPILGHTEPNSLVKIVLHDPDNVAKETLNTTSDKNGDFSLDLLRIPENTSPGNWTVDAKSGPYHNELHISVAPVKQIYLNPGPPPVMHMTINSQSNRYAANDTITISGRIDQVLLDQDHYKAQIEIYNPNNILYKSDQIDVNKNGTYSYSFKITGVLGISGWYDGKVIPAPTEWVGIGFNYESTPYYVTIGNTTFPVIYKINGGKINSIDVNPHENSITLHTNQVRWLTLKLPRNLLDAKDEKNNDISFLVFTNYTATNFQEISSDKNTRTLTLEVPPITEKYNILERQNAAIKIVGTILASQVNHDIILYHIASPVSQKKSGIPIKDIDCADGFQLLVKSDGETPACVKPETVGMLVLRGWASVNDLPSNFVCNGDCKNMVEKAGFLCNAEGNIFSCYVQNSKDVAKITIPKGASNQQSSAPNYIPNKMVVVLGKNSTVQWYNQDDIPSSVTSDLKKFDSTSIMPGHSWTFVFDRPGIYWYHSEPHPWMHAEVIVLPDESVIPSTLDEKLIHP